MYIEYSRSPYQKNWWDEKVIKLTLYVSRNDLAWVGIGVLILILYLAFPINLDWVLGKR